MLESFFYVIFSEVEVRTGNDKKVNLLRKQLNELTLS